MFPRAIGDKLPPVAVPDLPSLVPPPLLPVTCCRYRMEQPAAGRLVPLLPPVAVPDLPPLVPPPR